jgi:hypothetical protein
MNQSLTVLWKHDVRVLHWLWGEDTVMSGGQIPQAHEAPSGVGTHQTACDHGDYQRVLETEL